MQLEGFVFYYFSIVFVHISKRFRPLLLAKYKASSALLISSVTLFCISKLFSAIPKEIVTKIHHALGKEVPDGCFGSVQRADASMKYLALDGTKLKNAIGFEAQKSIEESLKEY